MSQQPNILLIVTDQHRKLGVGAYPGALAQTPALTALAEEGTVFDNAYTTCPICAPARASLQTGLMPSRHGVTNNIYQPGCTVHELPDRDYLLGNRLRTAGYATGFTGKWHLGWGRDTWNDPFYQENVSKIDRYLYQFDYPDEYKQVDSLPSRRGYDLADDFPGHGGGGHHYPQFEAYLRDLGESFETVQRNGGRELISSEATSVDHFLATRSIQIIDALRDGGKPWCHTLAFWGPHGPQVVPGEYLERYRAEDFEPWPNFGAPSDARSRVYDTKRTDKSWEDMAEHLRFYHAYCDYIDAQIKRVFDSLKASGEWDNTVVIFTADHGDGQGCHGGLMDKGSFLYEEVASIPLIVRDPKATEAPARVSDLVSLTDVYATVVDYAGGAACESYVSAGRSLLPSVVRSEPVGREALIVQSDALSATQHSTRLLRFGQWAFIVNFGGPDELYDLENDPWQLNNLEPDPAYRKIRDELRERMLRELDASRDLLGMAMPKLWG